MALLQTGSPRLSVLGRLASGGMGTVSLARTDDGQLVAVKRMHAHLAEDSHFLRMFLDEIWLTGALRHDNVVRLSGWGVDDAGPYFATEFVVGAPLGELLAHARAAGERLPHPFVAYIGARMADGLQAAHSLSGPDGESLAIVHRDVTPSNVLIGFDGTIKLTDFGVAKAAQKSSRTRTGMLKGKLSYMAPEYADGRGVDGRSDLYSLGVVLFQLMSGQRPFSGESDMELLRKIVDRPAPSVRSLVADLDPALSAIVDRLLEKEPDARARDAAQIANELDEWLRHQGHDASVLRARLAAYVERHCGERRTRLEGLMARDSSDGETLITQRWTAGTRPDETLARRAMALASDPEGGDSPVAAVSRRPSDARSTEPIEVLETPDPEPRGTRVARVSTAPVQAPPLVDAAEVQGEEVTAQTFAPVRRQLLGSRWGMLGVAVLGASVGGVMVALVVAAGRPTPRAPDEAAPSSPVAPESEAGGAVAADQEEEHTGEQDPAQHDRQHDEREQTIASASAAPSAPLVRRAPRPAAPRPSPARPKAACTPAHFDYPACLGRP